MISLEINYLEKSVLKIDKKVIGKILETIFREEKCLPGKISIIIASDNYIKKINNFFLNHDYYTDIITFAEIKKNRISGELYISMDRIINNAEIYSKGDIKSEMFRVIIHGILHLIGYDDYNEELKEKIRNKEDYYLFKKDKS